MGEYIPVQEFADLVGVTFGAVNKRVNDPDVSKYIQGEKGERTINTDASVLFKPRKSRGVKPDTPNDSSEVRSTELLYNVLQSTIQELSNQLSVKDNQIVELNEQIKQLNEHLKFSNGLVDQSQRLNAAEKVEKIITLAENVDSDPVKKTLREKLMFWK